MLEERIRGLIRLYPRGCTDNQLLWRLNAQGARYDASDLLAALDNLAQAGEIRAAGARWHGCEAVPDGRNGAQRPGDMAGMLQAVPASLGRPDPGARPAAGPLADDGDDAPAGRPDPAALLRYYAATQRLDPRGSVEAFPDGHGVQWQLFDCRGRWWDRATLSIRSGLLPPGFLQALARNGEHGEAAVGWPICTLRDRNGITCLPGLLLPASWELRGETLDFTVDAVQPALNPPFARHVRRQLHLTDDDLERVLEADEDGLTLDVVARRLGNLLARMGGQGLRPGDLAPRLAPAEGGLGNAAALFLPGEATFTRRVAEDLERIATWPAEQRAQTALAAVLDDPAAPDETAAAEVVEVDPLTDCQFRAADAALSRRLTVIQGPPGTGKSQTIVTLIASAVSAGKSVLFTARNHRALDEVEGRLAGLLGDARLVVRARDRSGDRNASMVDAMADLAAGAAATPAMVEAAGDRRALLQDAARTRATARRNGMERDRIHLMLADLVERQEDLATILSASGAAPGPRIGLLARLLGLFRRGRPDPFRPLAAGSGAGEIARRIADLRAMLAAIPEPTGPALPDARERVAALGPVIGAPGEDALRRLRTRKNDIEFQPDSRRLRHLTADDGRLILDHRPVWITSTLSVPARIPLVPALFDLAIFDEASQCDIASALPILARARRAVVVGDPEQLTFIPTLSTAREHALMDAVGLPVTGRGGWAQSRNSLFDLAQAGAGIDGSHLLPDQFRSAPAIVDYSSQAFYDGRVRARRHAEDFRPAGSYRPGLHWQDVRSPCMREDGGNVNRGEAEWIVARIAELAADGDFDGSIGVISPFSAQVGRIRRNAEQALPELVRQRIELNVDTVDGWQGGEADVIFLSLTAGPGAAPTAVSFLKRERRRFNVAISRARAVAVVVGDLGWARDCAIGHLQLLADRATRPATTPQRGFDSKWERWVNEALLARGLDPKPQYPVGSRSLDFALFRGDVKLDLEVDGRKWHVGAGGERKVSDLLRNRELQARGWKVRRFWVDELAADMEGCLDIIERDLASAG